MNNTILKVVDTGLFLGASKKVLLKSKCILIALTDFFFFYNKKTLCHYEMWILGKYRRFIQMCSSFFFIFKTSIVFVLRIGGLSIYYLYGINLGHVQGFSTGYWTYRLGRGWWNFLVCFSSLIVINTCAHRYCFLVFHNALHFCTIMLSLNVPREKYTCRI